MIKLPKNWKDGIQLRDFISPINQFGETGVLIFTIKNKHGQVFCYTQYIVIPGYEKMVSKLDNAEEIRQLKTKEGYGKMCYALPATAVNQDYVIEYGSSGKSISEMDTFSSHEKHVPITNDDWEVFLMPDLKLYKPQ